MRVAIFHNAYVLRGGEDVSTASEASMLRKYGVDVFEFKLSNAFVLRSGTVAVARALARSHYNSRVYDKVRAYCRRVRPDVAHVENFWFAMSPAVHAACHAEGIPTVQSLRNFRLLCAGDLLLRNGRPCNECVGRGPWRGVRYRCKNGSFVQSAFVARMLQHNRKRHTWTRDVDVLVASTDFVKKKLVEGGLPESKIVVMPNFVADPGINDSSGLGGAFVGRLSHEKGVKTLLEAWKHLGDLPLSIVGDGPLRRELEAYAVAEDLNSVTFLGQQPHARAIETLRQAAFVVMPSIWYEGFGRVIIEAFSVGRPVIASRLGSMAELINDGVTGLLFEPGESQDLADKITKLNEDTDTRIRMGVAARTHYEEQFTPSKNFKPLISIYERAIRNFGNHLPSEEVPNVPGKISHTNPTFTPR